MAKKVRAAKLPKRFAGIKVPKKLRRNANGFLSSAAGQAVVTEVLAAATAALIAHEAQPDSLTRRAGRRSARALSNARDRVAGVADSAAATVPTFQDAARAGMDAFSRALREGRSFGRADDDNVGAHAETLPSRTRAAETRPQV